jgi:hypothetical protein
MKGRRWEAGKERAEAERGGGLAFDADVGEECALDATDNGLDGLRLVYGHVDHRTFESVDERGSAGDGVVLIEDAGANAARKSGVKPEVEISGLSKKMRAVVAVAEGEGAVEEIELNSFRIPGAEGEEIHQKTVERLNSSLLISGGLHEGIDRREQPLTNHGKENGLGGKVMEHSLAADAYPIGDIIESDRFIALKQALLDGGINDGFDAFVFRFDLWHGALESVAVLGARP